MKLLINAQKIKLLVFALVIAAAVGSGIFIVSQNNTSKFQQQLKLGNEALLNLDYEEAITAFANAIGIDSNSVEAYLGIAEAYIGLNDYGMASEYLSIGYEEIPSPSILSMLDSLTPEDYVSLGKELLTQGNPDLAKDAFEEALKKDPNNEEALKGLEDAKNHPDYSGDEDAGNDAPSDGGASNPSNATPPAANNSSLQFDPYGFTFMGYPIHENHYEDWKSAVGLSPEAGTLSPSMQCPVALRQLLQSVRLWVWYSPVQVQPIHTVRIRKIRTSVLLHPSLHRKKCWRLPKYLHFV